METIKERLIQFLAHRNLSQGKFEASVGLSNGFVNNIGDSIRKKSLEKISEKYPELNILWLQTGIGDMLIPSDTLIKMKEIKELAGTSDSPRISFDEGVPYYNIDFVGGFDLIINDQTTNPDYYIDFKKYNEADCWCNITGHSMEPEITHGDIIALKEVKDWKTFLPFGEVYGIVTTEHRTIKRVTGSVKDGFFRLIPTNTSPEYAPQDIPVSLIVRMYKVLGCMKRL